MNKTSEEWRKERRGRVVRRKSFGGGVRGPASSGRSGLDVLLSPLEVRQRLTAIGGKDAESLAARPRRLLKKLWVNNQVIKHH
jgi:hypothetical protein